ncbi:MAG TPA: rod shape-determining protein RodA [Bacteroidales bacterium]|jgi:rod shape determining protein RodA|nr:FtsW/RodA/SpoVE family cell cycle protein [Bacteroidales bacterium]HNR41223.1 rod shape-determining protein RodA [Bacteroidales bacterium]HQG77038.1 rod shape-determining protein RodA [Bacteroidales bacterium]
MKRNVNIWARLDKISILIFVLMLIMGWFNIYAAVFNEEHSRILDMSQRYGKQFAWIIAALIIAVFVVVIDTRFYFFFAYFIYGTLMFLLVLVLFLGRDINGARSWFELGPFTFQPSEFAKFGTALALAAYLNQKKLDLKKPSVFFTSSAIIIFPALLIALQPDMGSTVVFMAFFIVLFREGMSPYIAITGVLMIILFFLRFLINNQYLILSLIGIAFLLAWLITRKTREILLGILIFGLVTALMYFLRNFLFRDLEDERLLLVALLLSGMVYAYYFYSRKAQSYILIYVFLAGSVIYINSVDFAFDRVLKPHQKERVEIMMGMKSDPRGTGYNVNQSIISIGSGGFLGKGYLKGTQTKFKFVPAQSTDFIFCTIGEEWGFAGAFVVIGLYTFLLLRLVYLAERQRSFFSRVYGYGVVSVLFIHFFINTGMTIGIVPVIGIPLPFFSYGGSSLIGFTILLFIFLRLDASRTEYLF